MTDEETTPGLIVCTGVCVLTGSKPGIGFHLLNADGSKARELFFDRKSKVVGSAKVGGVYQVEIVNEGRQIQGPMLWKRTWEDAADLLTWKANDDMVRAAERTLKARKTGEQEALDNALKPLDPLRHLYQRTDRLGRNLLEAQVLEYLRRNPVFDR